MGISPFKSSQRGHVSSEGKKSYLCENTPEQTSDRSR